MDKVCNKCQKKKSLSCYHIARRNKDGLFSTCKECRKTYDAIYYKRSNKRIKNNQYKTKNRQRIKEYKANLGCKFCLEREPVALDFHHLNDEKEYSIATKGFNYCWERLLLEIQKCELVCSNCHRKLHAGINLIAIR